MLRAAAAATGATIRVLGGCSEQDSQRAVGHLAAYSVIRGRPEAFKTLAVEGEKSYRESFDLIHPLLP
jgi:hypothetical protein